MEYFPNDVRGIVAIYLKENGYDGLYEENGECACQVGTGDFMSTCTPSDCKPGHLVFNVETHDYGIAPHKGDGLCCKNVLSSKAEG